MRFMVMIKATPQTEAGEMPSEDVLAAMGRYNEQLADAGVLLGGEGLQPSSKGARVRFDGERCSVVDGLFQTASLQEAIDWLRRCPPSAIGEAEIEIRQIFEAEDFGAEFTPELREQEERLRAQLNH